MKRLKNLFTFLPFFLFTSLPSLFSAEDIIFSAMEKELARSMEKLQFEDFKPPYFISYQLLDVAEANLNARYGAIVQDQNFRNRYLYVELRYGNYETDNTEEYYRGTSDMAPLEEDEAALRHRLWLMTDRIYKQAVRDYLQKQGKKIAEIEKEKFPDFSKEKPVQALLPVEFSPVSLENYRELLKRISAEFKKYPEVLDSGISVRVSKRISYLLNSEGTKIRMPAGENPFFIQLWARTQSEEGMHLDVSQTFSFRREERAPSEKKLKETVADMVKKLLQLRSAKLADPYTGPAILDSESTAVLFHEAVGHRLEGERQRDTEEGQTFKDQVGKEIIPPFLTVVDDPTLREWKGMDLNGFYFYDEEGVPAQRVVLVENGILKNYLLSRRPIKGFHQSNGHGRAQFGRNPIGRMANLMIQSSREFSSAQLKKMLLEECRKQKKPYGLLIKKTRSGDTSTARDRYQAFRGTPEEVFLVDAKTGEETLVKGVELVGTPLITINKIIATGKEEEVMNAYCAAESGTIPIASVAPSALVKEVELQRVREDKQRPPILPPPLHEK